MFRQLGRTSGVSGVGYDEAAETELVLEIGETTDEVKDPVEVDALPVSPAVTGHTVVEMAIVCVIKRVESAGQLVTAGAHEVTVISDVVKIVEVLYDAMDSEATEDVTGLTSVEDEEITDTLYDESVDVEVL